MSFSASIEAKEKYLHIAETLMRSPKTATEFCLEELRRGGYQVSYAGQNLCAVNRTDRRPVGLAAFRHEPACVAAVISAARMLADNDFAVAVWLLDKAADESAVFVQNRPFALLGVTAAPVSAAVVEGEPAVQLLVSITGFTAHGARPHLGINAVDAACLAASAVHALPLPPFSPAAVQILSIDAGNSSINMIPAQVSMVIEVRSEDSRVLHTLTKKIGIAVENAVAALSAKAVLTTQPVQNAVCTSLIDALRENMGADASLQTAEKCNLIHILARHLQCEAGCLRIASLADEEALRCIDYADILCRSAAALQIGKEA